VEAVRWAGVTENYHRIHWDEGFAQSEGLPRAIVNNAMILAWLQGLLEDTYGPEMILERLQARFRSPAPLEEEVRCGGTVA
jgi:hydroxyacyl-ACP dehydratase HTD2-like protein with hotdog domain